MTDLRVSVQNTSDFGGTFTTPFYFGFHDGAFDLFDAGEEASPGLEALAEDGSFGTIADERLEVSPDSQGLVVAGNGGPIATREQTSNTITVNGSVNGQVSFGAMILPSNDAFVGTDDALTLFDKNGNFLGAQEVSFAGTDVYDAGTEVNTELDAAFINQSAPDTGVDENGVIELHPGFNGSVGNPVGEGEQIILGGTNAFGAFIDPEVADFTLPGAQIATIHINTVVEREGSDDRDVIVGRADDDIVTAGDGNDLVFGRMGWDVLHGEDGNDRVFGGRGNDEIYGGDGNDFLSGQTGDDILDGGDGNDTARGGAGDDQIGGGAGNDFLRGGTGDDAFLFATGDDRDQIGDFDRLGDDVVVLSVEGIESFEDVLDAASESETGTVLAFGGGDSLFLRGVATDDLEAGDFVFI